MEMVVIVSRFVHHLKKEMEDRPEKEIRLFLYTFQAAEILLFVMVAVLSSWRLGV